jgi:hypothetical protein
MNGRRIDFVADTSAIISLCRRRDPQIEQMVQGKHLSKVSGLNFMPF